jgi:hypothetical protein
VTHKSLELLTVFAPTLPVQSRVVALFPSDRLKAVLESLPTGFPRLVRAASPEAFSSRIRSLYGIDISTLAGSCAFALVADAGPVLVCQGGTATPVEGSSRWAHGPAEGHTITRGGLSISISAHQGRLMVGSPVAVERCLLAQRKSWPDLTGGLSRWKPRLSEIAGADAFGDMAVFFLDPSMAPWCGSDCIVSAIFATDQEFVAAAITRDDTVETVQTRAAALWSATISDYATLMDEPRETRSPPVEDSWFKAGDPAIRQAELSTRGAWVFLKGPGDLGSVALALASHWPARLFGDD